MPLQARPGTDHIDFAADAGAKQLRHVIIGKQHLQAIAQALLDRRQLRIELAIGETQVNFIDQPITNLRAEVIGQEHFGGQRKKRRVDIRMIAGVHQFHSGVFKPLPLVEQLQHQGKQGAVEDVHVQPFKCGSLQQHRWQVAKAGAVDVHPRFFRKAGRLDPGLMDPVVATGQLNPVDTQRRAQALHQFGLNGRSVFSHQSCKQRRPAPLQHLGVGLEKLAHGASRSLTGKKIALKVNLERYFCIRRFCSDSRAIDNRRAPRQTDTKTAQRNTLPIGIDDVFFQQQRNARRHGIAGLDHVFDELLRLAFEAPRHGIDNRRTALVNAEGIDVIRLQTRVIQQLVQVCRGFSATQS